MNKALTKGQHNISGFTLAELLIVLALLGLLSILTFTLLIPGINQNHKQWTRLTDDYITHLEMACNRVKLTYGTGPLQAAEPASTPPTAPSQHHYQFKYTATYPSTEDPDGYQPAAYTSQCALHPNIPSTYVCNNSFRGIGVFLPTWESMVTYNNGGAAGNGTPMSISYPDNKVLYLRPDEADVADTGNEIPNEGSNNTPASFDHDDIMAYVDDREWVLLDMNGGSSPNSIAASGDRVLLHINDDSCKVLTARQKCREVDQALENPQDGNDYCAEQYPQSFYDAQKNYCSNWTTNCP